MPFVFIVIGLLFLVVAIRGTQSALFALLQSEFTGKGSFVPWAAAIFILGAIGYARPVRPVADGMIGLVILGMLLTNKGGFFTALNQGINNPVAPAVPASSPASSVIPSVASSTAAAQAAGTAQTIPAVGSQPATSVLSPNYYPANASNIGSSIDPLGGDLVNLYTGGGGYVDTGSFD